MSQGSKCAGGQGRAAHFVDLGMHHGDAADLPGQGVFLAA